MLAMLVGAFFLGSLAGAGGFLSVGFPVLIAPAVVLLTVAAPPLLVDAHRRRHTIPGE